MASRTLFPGAVGPALLLLGAAGLGACGLGACGPGASPAVERPAAPGAQSPPLDGGGAADKHEALEADALPLVPRPRSLKRCTGAFAIDQTTAIRLDRAPAADMRAVGEALAQWLGLPRTALQNPAAPGAAVHDPTTPAITLRLDDPLWAPRDPAVTAPERPEEESFTIQVSPSSGVLVQAHAAAGLFYGAQAVAQLAGARRIGSVASPLGPKDAWRVPCVAIEDGPRFPFRAMHLDVARHFFGADVIARWVDLLAFYRFNVFHWHLTDDQGFRFDAKSHPELARVGGKDGAYRAEEIAAVVAAARARFITVIPEIEMPGHARAVLASHPELSCTGKKQDVPRTWGVFDDVLCAGNEQTYALLGDVLGDVTAQFPSRLVHLGGDEVPEARWNACPKCRAAMQKSNVDAAGLQEVFMARMYANLATRGRRAVVWDEALPAASLRPGSGATAQPTPFERPLILAWQSRERGREAAQRGFEVVMAPYEEAYFNFHQAPGTGLEPGHASMVLPWTKVHAFEPIPGGLDPASANRVRGGEGALWTEYVETQAQLDTLALPRAAALADALWSGTSARADEAFVRAFGAQLPALDASGVKYFVEPPVGLRERKVFIDEATVSLSPPALHPNGVIRWTTDGARPSASSLVLRGAVRISAPMRVSAALFLPDGRTSGTITGDYVKEAPRPSLEAGPAAAQKGATCTYYEGDFHRLPDVTKLVPRARFNAPGLDLPQLEEALGKTMRKERFALACEAIARVPADGVYRFIASADDGVRLDVDGVRVLEDDGEHAPRAVDGEIALAAGGHRIRLLYFQGTQGKALELRLEGGPLASAPLPLQR